jgi:hypothetical protein
VESVGLRTGRGWREDVVVDGGAGVINQYLVAGLVDELELLSSRLARLTRLRMPPLPARSQNWGGISLTA